MDDSYTQGLYLCEVGYDTRPQSLKGLNYYRAL